MSTKFKIKSSETPIFFGNGEFCPEKFFLYNFSSLPFVIDFFTDVNNVKKIIDYLNAKTKACLEKVSDCFVTFDNFFSSSFLIEQICMIANSTKRR